MRLRYQWRHVATSYVAIPLSCKTKTTYFFQDQDHFFKTKTAFLKTTKLLTQDLKKRSLTEKIRPFMPVLPSHAGNRKKPAYYRFSSQVLLHPMLGSYDLKFDFVQN